MSVSPESQSFGDATAVFRLDGLLLRIVRERGQVFVDLALTSSPAEFYQYDDVEIALGWKTIDEVLAKQEPDSLESVLSRLRARLTELTDASQGSRAELTKARFERAARKRGRAFADRLHGKR